MDEITICRNIKKLRKQNHFTLEKLADLTGLTKGYLSKVERSEKAPPYSTLNKIAGALGIEVTHFFENNTEPQGDTRISIQRRHEAKVIRATSQLSGYDYEILGASKPGKNMEPFIIHSPFEITKMYSHEGEEFMYILEGTTCNFTSISKILDPIITFPVGILRRNQGTGFPGWFIFMIEPKAGRDVIQLALMPYAIRLNMLAV